MELGIKAPNCIAASVKGDYMYPALSIGTQLKHTASVTSGWLLILILTTSPPLFVTLWIFDEKTKLYIKKLKVKSVMQI